MAKTGKPKHSDTAPARKTMAGGKGGRPVPPLAVEAEQIRESDESRKARTADASQSVKKGHTGGR